MSEKKFPPRVWIWFYEENHASKRKGIREAHKCTPHGGKLQPEPTHISIQEHQHLMAEKHKRIERLREALQKCARANERNPDRGTGGPEYCLSRIDIKAFAEMALQEDDK